MKLLVFLFICATCLDLSRAKSEPAINRETKHKSTKTNALSTTPKPETHYQTANQQQNQQLHQNQQQLQQLQNQYQQHLQQYQQDPSRQQLQQYQQEPSRQQLQQYQQESSSQQLQQYQQEPSRQQLQQYQQDQSRQQLHEYQQYQQEPLKPQLQRPLHPQQHVVVAQPHSQPQLTHLVQRAFYVPQQPNQPAAMIIIAQPAYVPAGAAQGGAAQQLLNYFHGNPQARHQLLHGSYQQQAQPTQPPQGVAQQQAHSIGNYVVAVPAAYQSNVVAVPVQRAPAHHLVQEVPTAATVSASVPETESAPLQLAHIAQIAANQYSRINPSPQQEVVQPQQYHHQQEGRARELEQATSHQAAPIRSLPPIFTGFENFSPEQQEKIKAQLSAHFGAPLRPVAANRLPPQVRGQGTASNYQVALNTNEFVPSEQVQEDAPGTDATGNKSQYAKQ